MNIKLSILQCMWRNDPHRNHRATRCGNATHLRNVMSPMFNTGSHPTRVYTRAYDMTPLRGYGSSSSIHHAGVNTPAYGVSFLRNLDGA
ncbi:MAG: hypothetical protein VZQ98_18285 [Bacteroidales bacterium]|nr:hypothetical protein [Bacteroidales bacterium]